MHIAKSFNSYLPENLSDETRNELRHVNKLELELYTLHDVQESVHGLLAFKGKKSARFCGIFKFFKGLEELRIVIRARWNLADNTEDEQRCIKAYTKVLENCISGGLVDKMPKIFILYEVEVKILSHALQAAHIR